MTIVTEKEKFLAIQLWGDAQKLNDEAHINRHNLFMQIMAERYGYDWQTHTMNPETGEIISRHDIAIEAEDDGQPDEQKEWQDLEHTEQEIYQNEN